MDYAEKVILNLSADLIEQAEALRPYAARRSLHGKATRADVIRRACASGLAQMRADQAELLAAEDTGPDTPPKQ